MKCEIRTNLDCRLSLFLPLQTCRWSWQRWSE